MPYGEKILDHYNNPRNIGTLPKGDNDVGTGMVGAPECGDVMRLQVRVKDGIIVEAKQYLEERYGYKNLSVKQTTLDTGF